MKYMRTGCYTFLLMSILVLLHACGSSKNDLVVAYTDDSEVAGAPLIDLTADSSNPATAIEISFTAPTETGLNEDGTDASITGYIVEYSTSPTFENTVQKTLDSSLIGTLQDLSPNTTYYIRVAAINSTALKGIYSAIAQHTTGEAANTQANINRLIITLTKGDYSSDHTVDFTADTPISYPYAAGAPAGLRIRVKSISISDNASATYGGSDVSVDTVLSLTDSSSDTVSITILVTAENTDHTNDYSFILARSAASTGTNLDSLTITLTSGNYSSDHTVDFTADTPISYPYAAGAPAGLRIRVKSISISDNAEATYGGSKVSRGTELNLAGGDTVTIRVTAENTDHTNDYSFTIERTAASTEANIDSLTITLMGDNDYSADSELTFSNREASIDYPYRQAINSVIIAKISLSTGATASAGDVSFDTVGDMITIASGSDQISIQVTAEDASTDQTYIINFVEEQPELRHVISTNNGGAGNGQVPSTLSVYDELTQTVLYPYVRNDGSTPPTLLARYVVIDGTSDNCLSWADACSSLGDALAGISDANVDRIYLLLIASSGDASYDTGNDGLMMKNYVAIVGGWDASGGWGRSGTTVLSGGGTHRVIYNRYTETNPLTYTALLYGVSIEDGSSEARGGGIYNEYASPILTNVTIANNSADIGGGIFNTIASSPVLTNVTIANNSAVTNGGGIYNTNSSSPVLINVTIAKNITRNGSVIYSYNSSPVIVNSIIWDNSADQGSQIHVDTRTFTLAYSLLQGGADAIGNRNSPTIVTAGISSVDPVLGGLSTDGGSFAVPTMAIGQGSSADDLGVYVRRNIDPSGDTYYYSINGDRWYTDFTSDTDTIGGVTGNSILTENLPDGSIDLTATDATGRVRDGRPDAGAYEAR